MKFSRSWYWIAVFVMLMAGLVSCRDYPTEPDTSTPEETSSPPETPSPSETPSAPDSGTGKEVPSEEDSGPPEQNDGYCDGSELLCLPAMTPEYIAKYKGSVSSGTLSGGVFAPSSTGGIRFPLTIDTSRKLKIEFEIEGNIPNWNRGEHQGGKVSLFTVQQNGGNYYLSLQRMDRDYRGGGLFRVILGDRADILSAGAAWLITHRDLAGHYSMQNWGSERHQFEVIAQGNTNWLNIDSYRSRSARAPYGISGRRNVTFVLGNREPSRMSLGEGALTRFLRLRISYQ